MFNISQLNRNRFSFKCFRKMKNLLTFSTLLLAVSAFSGTDDKFIKKYAMMKIYESCFGPEVVRLIRKEMKAACAKCASLEAPPQPQAPPPPSEGIETGGVVNPSVAPPFDVEKLHQAILAYRPAVSVKKSRKIVFKSNSAESVPVIRL